MGVPLGFGAGHTGSELGVNAMRLSKIRGHSLAEHIRALGYEVSDHGDVAIVQPTDQESNANPKHLPEMLASSLNITRALENILANDEIPIILGGDHAIAIPTFLNQRKNGYRSALKADLKNAATAIESAAVDQQGDFTAVVAAADTLPVGDVEFTATDGNTVTVDSVTSTTYCIEAVNAFSSSHFANAPVVPVPWS